MCWRKSLNPDHDERIVFCAQDAATYKYKNVLLITNDKNMCLRAGNYQFSEHPVTNVLIEAMKVIGVSTQEVNEAMEAHKKTLSEFFQHFQKNK